MKSKKPKSGSRSVKAKSPDALAVLRGDFDQLLERMNTPAAKAAVDALFKATGAEIGKIAQETARDASEKSTARAGAAIGDAVGYVEASNRKVARLKKRR